MAEHERPHQPTDPPSRHARRLSPNEQPRESRRESRPPPVDPEQTRRALAKQRRFNRIAVVLAGLVSIPLVWWGASNVLNEAGEKNAYSAAMADLTLPPQEGPVPAGTPGKIAVIDMDRKELHRTHASLGDRTLRAWHPRDASVVVHLREEREVVSTYHDGTKGVRVTWHVTVIDRASWTALGRRAFVGAAPPFIGRSKRNEDVVGTEPSISDVSEYCRALTGGGR
jgi:hypothetical protein